MEPKLKFFFFFFFCELLQMLLLYFRILYGNGTFNVLYMLKYFEKQLIERRREKARPPPPCSAHSITLKSTRTKF